MGEADDDLIDLAMALREVRPDSIPVNTLHPVAGTPLEKCDRLTPQRCLRVLCLFRFLHPRTEIRIAGGREHNLRSLQPLGDGARSWIHDSGRLRWSANQRDSGRPIPQCLVGSGLFSTTINIPSARSSPSRGSPGAVLSWTERLEAHRPGRPACRQKKARPTAPLARSLPFRVSPQPTVFRPSAFRLTRKVWPP